MGYSEKIQANYEQEHEKMLKTNYWYKAWYETMKNAHALENKLSDLVSTISIYLDHQEPLPECVDKYEWDGYVLITESSLKRVLKDGKEAEEIIKKMKEAEKAKHAT